MSRARNKSFTARGCISLDLSHALVPFSHPCDGLVGSSAGVLWAYKTIYLKLSTSILRPEGSPANRRKKSNCRGQTSVALPSARMSELASETFRVRVFQRDVLQLWRGWLVV